VRGRLKKFKESPPFLSRHAQDRLIGDTIFPGSAEVSLMPFKATTYNVLATAYINPGWYAGVSPELLDPAWRVPALVRHVEELGADLLCLQEVEKTVFAVFVERLGALGYEGRYEKKGAGRPDGCATFFRKELFSEVQSQRLQYHDRGPGRPTDSGHIALLLCLRHEGRLLGVANTHIRWDGPGTPREEQVGYRQVEELLEACARQIPPCDGWLICGDFNRTPEEEAVTAMRRAGFGFAHADRLRLRSCVANGRAQLIDFLFHNAALRSRPMESPALTDGTLLPAREQPSDHIALVADFAWEP
jgi:mRNA deadenylase 3'-5' endonuclease subunit Ccr4